MLFLHNIVEELSTFTVLQHKKAHIIELPYFVKLDDIGMIQHLQNVDFVDKGLEVFQFFLLDSLDGVFDPRLPILSQIHQSKASAGKFLNKMIFFFDVGFVAWLEHLLVHGYVGSAFHHL